MLRIHCRLVWRTCHEVSRLACSPGRDTTLAAGRLGTGSVHISSRGSSGGNRLDASIIEAPTSTSSETLTRQTKKGSGTWANCLRREDVELTFGPALERIGCGAMRGIRESTSDWRIASWMWTSETRETSAHEWRSVDQGEGGASAPGNDKGPCARHLIEHTAVSSLKAALDELEIDAEPVPRRTDLKRWFRLFATLRNATRGHGATRPAESGRAATHLLQSIETIYGNLYLFRRPWVYLYQNLSGKFRVTRFGNDAVEFDYLKREPTHSFSNGVYIHFGVPMQVPLIESDPELSDFFLPNGGFSDKKYELLSYATDNRRSGDSSNFHTPPEVPRSETEPFGELLARGNCFSNAPEPTEGYIPRPALEGV